jgi:hypothetical protein
MKQEFRYFALYFAVFISFSSLLISILSWSMLRFHFGAFSLRVKKLIRRANSFRRNRGENSRRVEKKKVWSELNGETEKAPEFDPKRNAWYGGF